MRTSNAKKATNQHPMLAPSADKPAKAQSHVSSLTAAEIVSNPRLKHEFAQHLSDCNAKVDRKRLIEVSLRQIDAERESDKLYREYLKTVEEKLRPQISKRFSLRKGQSESPRHATSMTKYRFGNLLGNTSFTGVSRNRAAMNMTMMTHQGSSNLDSTLFREKLLLNTQMRTLSRLSQHSEKPALEATLQPLNIQENLSHFKLHGSPSAEAPALSLGTTVKHQQLDCLIKECEAHQHEIREGLAVLDERVKKERLKHAKFNEVTSTLKEVDIAHHQRLPNMYHYRMNQAVEEQREERELIYQYKTAQSEMRRGGRRKKQLI